MDIYDIMQPTCWGSLSYCCSLKKKCKIRDDVMKELEIPQWRYEKLKIGFDDAIQKMREKK